jgi:methionyl-tRNA formyltransferase
MTQKGYSVLKYLCNNKRLSIISKVIIGTDKSIEKDYASGIKNLCVDFNIEYYKREEIYKIDSEYSIAISWRWIIEDNTSKLIVLHDSILPKYRGFAPLVNMLINKEPIIGVTALYATDEYDKGDILAQKTTDIKYPIKIREAIEIISEVYIDVVSNIIDDVIKNKSIIGVKQDESMASYSLWLNEEDYLIKWEDSSHKIMNFINSVSYPYKGASTFINGKQRIRILDAQTEKDVRIENRHPGKIIFTKNNQPIVVCGEGLLRLTKVIDDTTSNNVLPFKKFRIKLTNENTF